VQAYWKKFDVACQHFDEWASRKNIREFGAELIKAKLMTEEEWNCVLNLHRQAKERSDTNFGGLWWAMCVMAHVCERMTALDLMAFYRIGLRTHVMKHDVMEQWDAFRSVNACTCGARWHIQRPPPYSANGAAATSQSLCAGHQSQLCASSTPASARGATG
jgi:hypothetical protein